MDGNTALSSRPRDCRVSERGRGALGKTSGELDVLLARSGITRWVIMDENDRGCAREDVQLRSGENQQR